jgi:hypothetical protein
MPRLNRDDAKSPGEIIAYGQNVPTLTEAFHADHPGFNEHFIVVHQRNLAVAIDDAVRAARKEAFAEAIRIARDQEQKSLEERDADPSDYSFWSGSSSSADVIAEDIGRVADGNRQLSTIPRSRVAASKADTAQPGQLKVRAPV